MRKNFILTCLVAAVSLMLSSCGESVDHSDPRSVAEHALKCLYARDYESLRSLVNPANEYRLEELDRMVQISKENARALKSEDVDFSFESMKDTSTGEDITAESRNAVVKFESGQGSRRVMLERADGKWYFDRFK